MVHHVAPRAASPGGGGARRHVGRGPVPQCHGAHLQHVSGEPLPWDVATDVVHDLHRAEDTTGYAPQPVHYAGVLC